MQTYRDVVNAVIEIMNAESDDSEISPQLVFYIIQAISSRLRSERLKKSDTQSGRFLLHFADIPIMGKIGKFQYIDLPDVDILDLPFDSGIELITLASSELDGCENPLDWRFERTTLPAYANTIKNNSLRNRRGNIFWSRLSNRIQFLNAECIDIKKVDIYAFAAGDVDPCDLDSELNNDPDQIELIIRNALSILRFNLIAATDRMNDGADGMQQMRNKTALSETDPAQMQQQQQVQE